MQINGNGVISFDRRFTAISFGNFLPLSITEKIIAPYWDNVDTRGTGNIYYRQTTDPSLLARTTSEIRAAYAMSQALTNLFIVTWDAVGYYNQQTDKVRK